LLVKISRGKLEKLVEDLVERTVRPARRPWPTPGSRRADIDEVVLSGAA
jgi:molecular chaperone DnaK